MLNLAKLCCQKPKTLRTTLIFGERVFFDQKYIFYFVSRVLSKIVGYHSYVANKLAFLVRDGMKNDYVEVVMYYKIKWHFKTKGKSAHITIADFLTLISWAF